MNGIFVVNHFSKVEPEKRGPPFTADALKLAKKHDIQTITTTNLYAAIGRIVDGSEKTESVRDRILKNEPL